MLTSWGREVVATGFDAEMQECIAALSRRPDLIICDYRLRDGETASSPSSVKYIERIPAVLITGDTASDRLQEAQEGALILVHKPVAEIKLRATVCNPYARSRLLTARIQRTVLALSYNEEPQNGLNITARRPSPQQK